MKYLCFFCFVFAAVGVWGVDFRFTSQYEYEQSSFFTSGLQIDSPYINGRLFAVFSPDGVITPQGTQNARLKNWSIRAKPLMNWNLYAGNITLSGVYSRLNNPVFYTPNALKPFSVSQTGLFVSEPSFSFYEYKTVSLVNTVQIGQWQIFGGFRFNKEQVQNQFEKGDIPVFAGFLFSFPTATKKRVLPTNLRGSFSFITGSTIQKPKNETSWFRTIPYFSQTVTHYAVFELALKNYYFETFFSGGLMQHSAGGLYFFSRNEGSFRIGFFKTNAAFSYTDYDYITFGGTHSKQMLNSYINPQFDFALTKDGTLKLQIGTLLSLKYQHTLDRFATPSFTSDIKGSALLLGYNFSLNPVFEYKNADSENFFAPTKETTQNIQFLAHYKTKPYKPFFQSGITLKYETYPFYKGSEAIQKSTWTYSLDAAINPFSDFTVTSGILGLFKKNEPYSFSVSAGILYRLKAKKHSHDFYADFLFENKIAQKKQAMNFSLKYVLNARFNK